MDALVCDPPLRQRAAPTEPLIEAQDVCDKARTLGHVLRCAESAQIGTLKRRLAYERYDECASELYALIEEFGRQCIQRGSVQ